MPFSAQDVLDLLRRQDAYQRALKTTTIEGEVGQIIEVTAADIVLANRLADAVLGRSIDELPPHTRRLLWQLYEMVQQECQANQVAPSEYRFLRRTVRERFGWGQTQLKLHLDQLVEMEYVLAHRAEESDTQILWSRRGDAWRWSGSTSMPERGSPQEDATKRTVEILGGKQPVTVCLRKAAERGGPIRLWR